MEKEANTALRWKGALGNGRDSGEAADGPEAAFSECRSDLEPMSPAERARQLPRKMWMIVVAASLTWAVVIAAGYLVLV